MIRTSSALFAFALFAGSHLSAQSGILGTAESFAVLAGSAVTNTGPSVIEGNLGVSPGSAVTGFPPGIVINGTIHAADAVALQAQNDTTTAYNTLAGMAPDQDLTGQDLGGMTLTPGVYFFSGPAFLTGTLTLNTLGDPTALFVFQIGSTLITASNSSVVTINGPNDCEIYWQVGSSATLGTGTSFQGNILALTSITLTTGTSIQQGRALARNGAVTLDDVHVVAGCTCILGPTSVDCNSNGVPDECDIDDGTTPDCNANGIPDVCDLTNGTPDCNGNGIPDVCDIAGGLPDCNANGIPDVCDLTNGTPDCNGNGIPDVCDIAGGLPDCNANGIPDICDLANGAPDCNGNGIPDVCDIAGGLPDCNANGIPDICDLTNGAPDCNGNGIPDVCDIAGGLPDCNANGIPDICDIAGGGADCNNNGIPDRCDLLNGTSTDCDNNLMPDECQPDCNGDGTPDVCELDCNSNGTPDECETLSDCDKDGTPDVCEGDTDCNNNGIPDQCETLSDCDKDGTPDVCEGDKDCNNNGIPDQCETLSDCDKDGVPDVCEGDTDCNNNGIPDQCETLSDCDKDGVPDVCEGDTDCNNNGIPDQCEGLSDCDGNGVPDVCVAFLDCNSNGMPDVCEMANGAPDCNGNGIPDVCDITNGTARDCNRNGIPDICDINNGLPDCNSNGIPDICDIGNGTEDDCNGNGIPDECDGGCEAGCVEFDRFENLSPNDTLTLLTSVHNPQSHQGYAYLFAVNNQNVPIGFDGLIGTSVIVDGMGSFAYSMNALDYRAKVALGQPTDLDSDGIRDLNGLEYERTPGELLVPVFIGQKGQIASQLILIALSGGTAFQTTAGFRIYNDNEEPFSAEHTFRCWEKVDLLDISGAFHTDFLRNSTSDDPDESISGRETGWFRVAGDSASSGSFGIDDPAIYAVYIERVRASWAFAELPFEFCTQSGHLLPNAVAGDNQEAATGGISDRDCTSSISRRRPGSLLVYPEFDNRAGMLSVFTVTNTNPSAAVRVHVMYIGR